MIDRRKFVELMSGSLVATGTASAAATEPLQAASPRRAAAPPSNRPTNVVLMICDDLGFGDLGCYGSRLPTPNLDRLALAGMRFTRFNSGHPLCSASRAALLTGRYGTRSGTLGAFGPNTKVGTSLDETLLPQLFKARGYRTGALGKWHLGGELPYLPTSRGFDSYFGLNWSVDMRPAPLMRDAAIIEEQTDLSLLTPRYTAEALRFLKAPGDQPFFLYLGFAYPHNPPLASPRFKGRSGFGNQGDAIAEIDWSVGEILRTLEETGHTNDTLVLFTSDHGPWGQGCPGLLRGRKASTFEGGFRVPLLARLPGVVAPGSVCDTPASNLDILPTLSNLCGLTLPPKPLDGVDMSPLLRASGTFEQRPRLYFSPMSKDAMAIHCIRLGDWKLRVAQATEGEIYINDLTTGSRVSGWLSSPELYNVRLDPAESYDVANLHPDMVATLQAELDKELKTFPSRVQESYAELQRHVGKANLQPGTSPALPRNPGSPA